jgi:transcriptional regulator with XRE-family HTH domain
MKKLDIKRALSEHNMTQADLNQKIGMSPQAICMIIKNNNPTVAKLMQIAEGIGCDITDLFYPDPAEEAEKKEIPAETGSEGEALNATLRGDLPEGTICRDVKFVQQGAENAPACPVHENGLVSEDQQQQMIQTSTFCPHCGKKVRVGVVLLDD